KSLVKITKTRVETVKRKKNSVCKYLKNDIVDLLKNSLDYNAYGRAEGLIEEKRRLSCYDLLEQFCICVASNVSLLQKSSKCPDECREAISSLVYAAARVSEVPELRDLRSLFADRYGNSLEHFVNPEFVEGFKAEPPSKEMKVELLQEIAREYSIKWDAKSLQERLYTPHHHHPNPKSTNQDSATANRSSLSFHGRKESWDDDSNNKSMSRRSEDDSMSTSESCVSGPEEDPEAKPFYYRFIPAPYSNQPRIEKQESLPEKMTKSDIMADDAGEYEKPSFLQNMQASPDDICSQTDSPTAGRPKPRSVRRRLANPPPDPDADAAPKQTNKTMRTESMEKSGGEGIRRMSRRTASWQPRASNVPDFDEVAARLSFFYLLNMDPVLKSLESTTYQSPFFPFLTRRITLTSEEMEESEIHVMSEVHLGCPPATNGPFLSRFTFSFPPAASSSHHCISVDKDGDLLLPRRTSRSAHSFTITIQHCITSTLRDVGLQALPLQVWKAELVLSDFVLHKMCTSSLLNGIVCLELGAGTGLLSLLLAQVAKAVFLTDHGDEILGNCVRNVEMNSSLFNPQAVVNVRELDWTSKWPIDDTHGGCRVPEKYCWSSQDFEQVKNASFIFAADVIYSDDLTIALFAMLKRVMSFGCDKVLYLGLEKRYNFSMDDLDVVANGYACFRSYIQEDGLCERKDKSFVGKRIDVTQIPQYTKGYDRGEDVELWEIKYVH
ncbi:unnamed protein product, partial [Thlaspi arvense]